MSETIDKLILNNNLEEAITQCSNENKYSLCKLLCLIGNIQVSKLPKVKVISQVKQEHRKAQLDKQLDKLSYELIESIDYSTMSPTKEIYNLCKGNDFRYKKGIVADALNHYNLWKRLLDDKENEYYIILEDTFDDKTSIRFNELSNKLSNEFLSRDMLFIGSNKSSIVNTNTKSVCFIHSCNINGNTSILKKLLSKISHISFQHVYIVNLGIPLDSTFTSTNTTIIQYSDNIHLYEIPTINFMRQFSINNPGINVLYLHTKGVSHNSTPNVIIDWTDFMLYSLTEYHDLCSLLLHTYDTVGCNYSSSPYPHYSGNFWWSKTDYIKSLKEIPINALRHDCEWWILTQTQHFFVIHNTGLNHYHERCLYEQYSKAIHDKFTQVRTNNYSLDLTCLIDKKLDSIEMHAYSINKCGAQKCVNYIQQNGLKHRIQDILSIIPNLDIYKYCNPVTFTQKLHSEGYNEELDFLLVYKSNYTFIPGMDHGGDDLYRKSVPLHEQFMIADDDPNCAGFNTLGFFKKKVTKLEKSQYFRENDGIYIKKQIRSLTKSNEKRIRVKMMCNWCSSESLCKEWSNMCENGFSWKNIDITWTDENIDYYVIINSPPRDSYYDPKRTIVFQMEPWVYDLTKNWGVRTWGYWAKPDPSVFMAVRGRHSDCHNNAFWQLELSLKQLLSLKAEKTEVISSICSSKYFDEGHIARIDLLKYIESKNDSSINIHVYNQDNKHNFKHYKGPVSPYIDKSKGMLKYKYYFMIENNYEKDFITEKIWEPILCESLVFYYGCPNVSKYINSNAYVLLDITDFEKSYQIIKRAIEEDWWSKRIDSIREEKRKILEEMAFFPIIHKIIHESTM